MKEIKNLDDLKGLVIDSIKINDKYDDEIVFNFQDGNKIKMYHNQDCCENVQIDDICGDINDLIDSEIIHFEERSGESDCNTEIDGRFYESFTYTFYDIQTMRGSVNIKWLGESNGYYSESVSIVNLHKEGYDRYLNE